MSDSSDTAHQAALRDGGAGSARGPVGSRGRAAAMPVSMTTSMFSSSAGLRIGVKPRPAPGAPGLAWRASALERARPVPMDQSPRCRRSDQGCAGSDAVFYGPRFVGRGRPYEAGPKRRWYPSRRLRPRTPTRSAARRGAGSGNRCPLSARGCDPLVASQRPLRSFRRCSRDGAGRLGQRELPRAPYARGRDAGDDIGQAGYVVDGVIGLHGLHRRGELDADHALIRGMPGTRLYNDASVQDIPEGP